MNIYIYIYIGTQINKHDTEINNSIIIIKKFINTYIFIYYKKIVFHDIAVLYGPLVAIASDTQWTLVG